MKLFFHISKVFSITACALAVFVAILTVNYLPLYAKSITDLQNQQKSIKQNKEEAKKVLDELESQKTSVKNEFEKYDEQLSSASEQLYIITTSLETVKEALELTEIELENAEKEKDTQMEIFKERTRYMYMYGKVSYLDIVLKSKSFSELATRVDFINRIISYDKNLIQKIQDTEDLIIQKHDEIEKQKLEQTVLAREQEKRVELLTATMEEKKQAINKIMSDEQKYWEQIEAWEKTDKDIENLIKAELEKQARAATYTIQNPYVGGKLGWPVPGRYTLSSNFGNRLLNGKGEFHKGIDIPAPTGTDIVSAEDGVIISAGWYGTYGNAVVINHGNGLTTLYGHNSKVVVSAGQTVKRGEVIAKAGSTGNSTGPHCHFEVRVNGVHKNPQDYL